MGRLIRSHDWTATPLGEPASWPQALRTAVRLLLNTGHPMYIFWGPELLCFYNDAYRQSIGPERHPQSLGQPARQVWDEVWSIIGPQIEQVMSGQGATWHENQLVPITRNGRLEEVYWTYSYGPIDDETAPNGVGGVLVVCTETTKAVLAERRLGEEAQRHRRLFEQAPGFVIVMQGPHHVVEFVNEAHRQAFGSEDWLGKPLREAFPDIAGQGYFELLDKVHTSGEPYQGRGAAVEYRYPPTGHVEKRFLDFTFAPILGDDGEVTGIFCAGYDVTDRIASEQLQIMLNRELGHRMKNQLAMVQAIVGQTVRSGQDIETIGKTIINRIQVLARAHDILVAGEADGARVGEVLRKAVSLHDDRLDPRYVLTGPALTLAARPALSLALIIHELATNAAKYGALASPDGEVHVDWGSEEVGDALQFYLRWREVDGVPMAQPAASSAGTRLIKAGLAGVRDGSVKLEFTPEGVRCEIRADLGSVQEER
jgi:two-component sensor histidine kinase